MKNLKNFLVGIVALALPLAASAQAFDEFAQPKNFIVFAPVACSATVTGGTNDIRALEGIGKIDLMVVTNTGDASFTVDFQGSVSNNSGWTSISNIAVATTTTVIVTNAFQGLPGITNTILVAGTIITPTSGTAGFANQYVLPAPFTNASPFTITASGAYEYGLDVADAPRYLRIVVTGCTNKTTVGAILTARRSQ